MRHHVMIVLGLVIAGIFLWRGLDALAEPGIGLREAYVAGGLVLALALIITGIRAWRARG